MNKLFLKVGAIVLGAGLVVGSGVAIAVHKESFKAAKADTTASVTISELGWGSSTQNALGASNAQNIDSHSSFYFTATDGNTGKYYSSSPAGARMYQSGSPSITVQAADGYVLTEVTLTYNVKNGGVLHTASGKSVTAAYSSGTAITVASKQAFTAYVANSGDATNGQVAIAGVAVKYVVSNDPVVAINNAPASVEIGAAGTLTASGTNATNPSYTWTSSAPAVLSITSAGAYEALAAGKATVTVSMTCDEGSASKTADIIVNTGLITINEAKAICAALDSSSNETTVYKVKVSGYITNLNVGDKAADKVNAFMLADAKTDGNELMAFGIYSNNPLRNYAVINGTACLEGNLQNYSGTYELKVTDTVSYSDDAMTFAKSSYEALNTACETGPAAVTDEAWNALATAWASVDSNSQVKLREATSSYEYSDDIAHWIDRYDRIVASGKTDFMGRTSGSNRINRLVDNHVALIVILSSSIAVISAVALVFVLKRKRHN